VQAWIKRNQEPISWPRSPKTVGKQEDWWAVGVRLSEKDRQDMLFRQQAILTMRRLPPLDQSLSA